MATRWAGKLREEGRIEDKRQLLQELLERKFGSLTPSMLSTIQGWPEARLKEALMDLYDGKALADLGFFEEQKG
jgi:hypothetical protein